MKWTDPENIQKQQDKLSKICAYTHGLFDSLAEPRPKIIPTPNVFCFYEFHSHPTEPLVCLRLIECGRCKTYHSLKLQRNSQVSLSRSRKTDQWQSNQAQIKGSVVPEGAAHKEDSSRDDSRDFKLTDGGAGDYGIDSNQEVRDHNPSLEEANEWTMNKLKQSGTEGANSRLFRGDWKPSIQGVNVSPTTIRFIQVGIGKCEVANCPKPERTSKSGRRGRPILVGGIWRRVCQPHYSEIERAGLRERVKKHRGNEPTGVLMDTRRGIGVTGYQ